jgi:hypothetical protein
MRSARSPIAIARLWLPTAASTSMLTLEIPLLLALAARVGDHVVAVAGLGLALAVIVPVNAAALALCTTTSVAPARRWPGRAVFRYTLGVGAMGVAVLGVVASGLLDGPIESGLGLRADTWDSAQQALLGLLPAPMLVALRRHIQGYLIAAGDTACFFRATLARMLTSVLLAALFTQAFGANTLGIGIALTVGVAVEAGTLWRHKAHATGREIAGGTIAHLRAIASVHVPLSGSMLLTVMPPTAVLLLLGASDGSAEALAAWPVLYGLAWLIAGTTIDLEAITASNHRDSKAATQRFAYLLGIALTALLLLMSFHTIAHWYFHNFSGLSARTTEVAMAGAPWLLLFPALCVTREWMRGALVARGLSPNTVKGVAVGFVAMLATFGLSYGSSLLTPIEAAALSVLAGAGFETAALWVLSRQPTPQFEPRFVAGPWAGSHAPQPLAVAHAAAMEDSNPEPAAWPA